MERPTLVPVFLEAKTKEDLVLLMLSNNLNNGMHFKYFSPIKEGKKWVVWYYRDIKSPTMARELKEANDS